MKPFHYKQDPLYAAAATILAGQTVSEEAAQLEEGIEQIVAAVANYKKGDKTNFGVVTDIGPNSISFKAKDLPVTKIAFNQRKMGSKDFVLDKLVKLKEDVELEERIMTPNVGTATITAPGNKLHGKRVSIFHKFDDGRLNVQYAKSDKKGDVLNLTLNKGQYKIEEDAELEEAYTTKNASVRKVMALVGEYSNREFEDLLFSLAELQLAGGNGDNVEQIALGKLLYKAAVSWKKRSQFDESVELEEAVKSFGTTLNYTGSDRMMYKKLVVAFDKAIQIDSVSGIQFFFYDGYNPMVKLANGKYAELSKGELKELRARFKEAGMKFPRPER
jgi:hypothetical protein